MKNLFALFLITLLAGCASGASKSIDSLNAIPDNVIVCGELSFSSGTAGTVLPVQGNGSLKYIRLPVLLDLNMLTPELVIAIEQAICP